MMTLMHVFCDVTREKPYQDTKPGSNDELAAIRLEGKVINTDKATMTEKFNTLFYYQIFTLILLFSFVLCLKIKYTD